MRYLGNDTNIVRDAVLTATNGVSSDAISRTDDVAKVGGGNVSLTGPYTGASDTTIDIEIVDNGGSTIQVSQPAFSGVGNGEMSDVVVVGIDPQTVTVTLEDLGTQTLAAYAPFQGVNLRAVSSGTAGNAITIDVDHDALVDTDTDWALQEDLQQEQNEYIGDHWNYGAAVLEPSGTIPSDAPRIRFGNDPQVYRQWKRYRDGRYVYSFSPAPVRNVESGAPVHAISGSRSLTITDGVDTETLTGIVTLYDALSAIRDNSDLVIVDGPIINDRLPGGQGITELSVWTRSYILGVTASGSQVVERAELDIDALDTAPTETLTIACVETSQTGSEGWEVRGDVSGQLANAETGVAYADGKYTLTIPLPLIDPAQTTGTMVVEYIPIDRGDGTLPSLCVGSPRLGAAARDGTWDYVYTQRPPDACDCTTGSLEGGPSNDCLGITPGVDDMSEASVKVRMQRLSAAVRSMVGSNTPDVPSLAYNTDGGDVNMVIKTAGVLQQALLSLSAGTLSYDVWAASTVYAADTIVETTTRNGYRYAATTPGTTGATEPTWTTTVGDTFSDGSVEWTCISKLAIGAWDDLFVQWSGEMALLNDIGVSTALNYDVWTATTAMTDGARPTTRNGHIYRLFSGAGGSTGATEPTWTTDGSTVVDGDITWIDAGAYWSASTALAKGHLMLPGTGVLMRVYSAGTTGTTEPAWPGPDAVPDDPTIPLTITDGSLEWAAYPLVSVGQSGTYAPDLEYYERWNTAAADVLAAAEITPNFDVAGANGDGCWLDFDDSEYWWVFDGTEPYLPIQTGHYYHASKMGMDEDGEPYTYSTREFGFGPRFGCPESLLEGDTIRITITGASGSGGRGYQVGDTFQVRVNQANPLPFGGGQTGDDTLTWSVSCSDDGALENYELVTTAPVAYAGTSGTGTMAFLITPGGIDFALGDSFTFDIEGGRFRWRQDNGSWSSSIDIADTLLADGLTATFAGGVAPSWVAGDAWSFSAEATYGVDHLRTPIDGEFEWTGSTVVEITPTDGAIVGIMIANHSIPSDAVIRLQGSDDNFSTTPLNTVVAWRRGDIWQAVTADYAKYRVTVDKSGSARWLYLGESTQPSIRTGAAELGRLTKRIRIPGVSVRKAISATVEHEGVTQDAADELEAMLAHAGEYDDRLLGIVLRDDEPECGVVRYNADSVEFEDLFGFQPAGVLRLQSVTMQLEASP